MLQYAVIKKKGNYWVLAISQVSWCSRIMFMNHKIKMDDNIGQIIPE